VLSALSYAADHLIHARHLAESDNRRGEEQNGAADTPGGRGPRMTKMRHDSPYCFR
jgi:hypothetical protein